MPIKEWANHIAFLNELERTDPLRVIETFCHHATIYGMRQEFLELFTAAMYSSHFADEEEEAKGDRMWLMEITIKLGEAAYLLDQLKKEGKLLYSVSP